MATISYPTEGEVKALLTVATAADNELVAAAPANTKIRVRSLALVSAGANIITFKSATTAISGAMSFAANSGIVLPWSEHGWFETDAAEALNMTLTETNSVGIIITYVLTT